MFVLDWKKKLGYSDDPFTPQPKRHFLVGRTDERHALNLFVIKHHRFGLLLGAKQTGKSTLLGWLNDALRKEKQVENLLVQDAALLHDRQKLIDALLEASMSIVERKVTKPHAKVHPEKFLLERLAQRRLVLLIDDSHELVKETKELLTTLLEACPGVQIILAAEKRLKEHDQYGEDQLGLTLEPLSNDDLRALLRARIESVGGAGTFPFGEQELGKLLKEAKGNPAKLLAAARERAIELSLTVEAPKRKAQEDEVPVPHPSYGEKPEGKKWFMFRFVKDETPAAGVHLEPSKDEPALDIHLARDADEKPERPRERSHEAIELADHEHIIIHADEPKKPKAKKAVKAEVDDVISSLMQEMEKPKRRK